LAENKNVNVGTGMGIYIGKNVNTGNSEFLSLLSSPEIAITRVTDDVCISMNYANFDITRCKGYTHWCLPEELDNAISNNNSKIYSFIANEISQVQTKIATTISENVRSFTDARNSIIVVNSSVAAVNHKLSLAEQRFGTIISDSTVTQSSTWSSQKINDALEQIKNNNANNTKDILDKINFIEKRAAQENANNALITPQPSTTIISNDSAIIVTNNNNNYELSVCYDVFVEKINPQLKDIRTSIATQVQKISEKIANASDVATKTTAIVNSLSDAQRTNAISTTAKISELQNTIDALQSQLNEKNYKSITVASENTIDTQLLASQLQMLQDRINNQDATIEAMKRTQAMLMGKLASQQPTTAPAPQPQIATQSQNTPGPSSNSSLILPIATGECRNTKDNAVPPGVSYFEFIAHFTLSGDFTYTLPKTPQQGQYIILCNNTEYAAKGITIIPSRKTCSYLFANGAWRAL
jgi:hypothetical protein